MLNVDFFYHLLPRKTISKLRVNLFSFYTLKLRASVHKNVLDKW
jgi:hypothetical protein